MKSRILSIGLWAALVIPVFAQPDVQFRTPFEEDPNYSASYFETIEHYQSLDAAFPELELREYSRTDAGYPLHAAILSTDLDFDAASLQEKGKTILLVMNAIHPGEPCGVDASMLWVRDLLLDESRRPLLEELVIVVIPFYNIGGGLNRGPYSRANQVGPAEHGFRGNARNYDLNRDFIKADTRNAFSFMEIFREWQPHVFIDNHTSNGADYQYTLTLIATQKDKLAPSLAAHLEGKMLPYLYAEMAETDWEMTPYVNVRGTPENGISGFLDYPRYSTGYTALHNTIGFMPETHMFKPFADRVWSVYHFEQTMVDYLAEMGSTLRNARRIADTHWSDAAVIPLDWELNREEQDSLLFKGYEAAYKTSEVTGLERMYYDRSQPYEKYVPYFNTFLTTRKVEKPLAYIVPRANQDVLRLLRQNKVPMQPLRADTIIRTEMYYIREVESLDRPYEGHFVHREVVVEKVEREQAFRRGDMVIPMGNATDYFVVSVLEPEAPDSYFRWNFFDAILGQKEYFSSYVFEDRAAELLAADPELRAAFEVERVLNPEFAASARAQLDWIYRRSPHYEDTHRLYPVGRVVE